MSRAGDDRSGYVIEPGETGALSIRVWGFWEAAIATAFARGVAERLSGVARLAIDAQLLRPMRDEVERAFVAVLAMLPAHNLSATIVASATMRLQLQRLVKAAGANNLVRFRSAAAEQTAEDLVKLWASSPKL